MAETLPGVPSFFPFWDALSQAHRDDLLAYSAPHTFCKGDLILPYKGECLGLILIQSGQLRAFVLSDGGKEITLYRLFERDICLFSASCIMNNIQFDIHIEAEKDSRVLVVPAALYDRLMQQSLTVANYTNQLMSSRFSDVMWTLEQVLFKSMDVRIAQLLLEQAGIEDSLELEITHDIIARDLSTAREVVTRMLKYFRDDGLLALSRGHIRILDTARLRALAAQ